VENLQSQNFDTPALTTVIQMAQQGDAQAFEYIYKLHCKRVYALCLRMVRDTSEAEDLTQDVFMQLFRKIHMFRGESAFSTWLHRVTANVVLMQVRRKKPVGTSLDDFLTTDEDNSVNRHEFGVRDLRLTGMFDRVNLQMAINQLPKSYKTTFILHDVQGYEHKKIAKILGCSVGTSKSQLHRARKRLCTILQSLQHFVLAESH
jgi:RNA polymerase sigma-70 factor, ECF subfamily